MVNTTTRFAYRKRTMMYNVEDLKSRALVESNILKQFILSTNAKNRGEFKPKLDDILIHDYQMANSVTLNVILSNYMVDLAYAVDCMGNPLYGGAKDSYFKMVRHSSESPKLDDQTRLVLSVDEDSGTFESRDLTLDLLQIWDSNEKVTQFINLDSIWYCKKVVDGHDTIAIVSQMNNFNKYVNPFGDKNPFDQLLWNPRPDPYVEPTDMGITFNQWMGLEGKEKLNCIIENRFYKNVMRDEGALGPDTGVGRMITDSRYLLCVPGGFYGLESYWDSTTGGFKGFILHDIGEALPIIDRSFDYKFCSFHVIGKNDETTLFLAIQDGNNKYHYLYVNESSLDETYGFTEIDSVVVDQLIVPPYEVFSKVDKVRELDTVNIALTDYGFWDLEANTTNNQTYSYRGGKKYTDPIQLGNQDGFKLTTPTMDCPNTTRFVEYSDDGDAYAIDRRWEAFNADWYLCRGLEVNPDVESDLERYKKYRSSIVGTGQTPLPFFGATEHFAVYDSTSDDPIHVLVNLTQPQFTKLLFANSQLTTYFIEWLYGQVVQPLRGEYYLYDKNPEFIENLEGSLEDNSFDNLTFQIGRKYTGGTPTTTVELPLSTKFQKISSLIGKWDSSASKLTGYCTALYNFVKDNTQYATPAGRLGVTWLYDNGSNPSTEEQLTKGMYDLFSKITWPDEKQGAFVDEVLDNLLADHDKGGFPLLRYFHDYLDEHLRNDLKTFKGTYDLKLDDDEKKRVLKDVQEYVRGKVSTALVLGGYTPPPSGTEPSNSDYPGIDQYIFQNQRKLAR